MKFKLFSAVLLLVCFVFLGVLSGVIPVTELPGDVAAGLFPRVSASPDQPPDGTPKAAAAAASPSDGTWALPEAKLASTMPPYTMPPATVPPASPSPAGTASPRPSPTSTPGPTLDPTPAPTSTPGPTLEPTPAPTSAPAPEVSPVPEATAAPEQTLSLWEPAAAVISTTITWRNDPIQNETSYEVDGKALLGQPLELSLPSQGPQVLIIHTHGTEAYTPSGEDQYEAAGEYRTTDPDHSILRVGQALGDALAAQGLDVLVDTGLYDWPNYDGAYGRSAAAVQTYLEEHPTIRVVIDLHRDAIGDDDIMYRAVSDQLQPEAAQIMFVVGTDTNLAHPAWRENLAFAMGLQGLLEEEYPHLMRPTLLSPYRYNQQMTPASVLLEIGAAGNTLQEALTAAELFAGTVGPALAARIGA